MLTIFAFLFSAVLKKAFKRFQSMDRDSSGLIDYAEFCELLMVDPSPANEKLFQLFDGDKSGSIDIKEFLIGLSNFTSAGKDDKLKMAFGMFDENGDGVITREELTKILKANHMASDPAEVSKKAETILAQADKDGDGVINFDEFITVAKRFPNILYPSVSTGCYIAYPTQLFLIHVLDFAVCFRTEATRLVPVQRRGDHNLLFDRHQIVCVNMCFTQFHPFLDTVNFPVHSFLGS